MPRPVPLPVYVTDSAGYGRFALVRTRKDVHFADGRLKVQAGAVGYIVSEHNGRCGVVFDRPESAGFYVEPDGSGLPIQDVPFLSLEYVTPTIETVLKTGRAAITMHTTTTRPLPVEDVVERAQVTLREFHQFHGLTEPTANERLVLAEQVRSFVHGFNEGLNAA